MALKNLTTSIRTLSEQQIESVVSPYVRYDPEAAMIVLLPAAARLTAKNKILVYLAALQGWPFVTDKAILVDASPSEIEKALHIAGGTVRSLLMAMRQEHLVVSTGGRYAVTPASVDVVRSQVEASSPKTRDIKPSGRAKAVPERPEEPRSKRGKRHGGEGAVFAPWLEQGFFDTGRTFGEVLERFHKDGRIIKSTSLPGYLLGAVRSGFLDRDKKEVGGRRVYVYRRPKLSKK